MQMLFRAAARGQARPKLLALRWQSAKKGRTRMKKLIGGFAAMAFTMVATVALAQTPAPPANDPIKRTPLQKTEYPDGHFTYVMMVEIAPNATIGRHTHPGIESSYVLEGNLDLVIEGKPPQAFKAGDSFTVPLNAVHGGKVGDKGLKLIGVYVVDKTKPLATPAPASQ
jgi:quercetin dioxygenase-like cupin family protein